MPPLIQISFNAFQTLEKRLRYKFGDKERERSNHAARLAEMARGQVRGCPMRHDRVAISGPPYDAIRAYICLDCKAAACEPEIKDRGYDFDLVPDWIMDEILNLDLKRQAEGNIVSYASG
jgi:hypothetical protein